MNIDSMNAAVEDAHKTLGYADLMAARIATLLVGRLRKVNRYGVLRKLKLELRDYNAHTGKWKEDKE